MKKILIVDDHADIRRLIRMTLEFEDYDVREAGLQAGADTYLVKPFSPLQLISCIAELWAAA